MTLKDVLDRDLIKIPLESTTKHDVLEELIDVLVQHKQVNNREELLSAIIARETLGSTGLVDGIAIPHAKTKAINSIKLVLGITKQPIDFDAQDGKGSQFFFLVLAPEKEASAYVEVLASIARATHSAAMRRLLAAARNADDVFDLFFD
ncbi:MAG: PTS sugar transporter subunit IIA [Sphaerochaetaceae bacterium]|jgi:PTS system nitrogen regulatory IIA component